jgi:hypothetical protein
MTNGKPTRGDLQDWMRCADVHPFCQANRVKNFSSQVQIAWVYTGKKGREVKTKNKTRISAAELRLKNLPDTARRFFGRRAIHLAAEILDSFEWKSNTSTPRLRLNLWLILRRKERA